MVWQEHKSGFGGLNKAAGLVLKIQILAPDSEVMRLRTYAFLAAAHDEVGFYVVLLQVHVPLSPSAWLHVIVSIQVVQRGLGDVNTPGNTQTHTHTHRG